MAFLFKAKKEATVSDAGVSGPRRFPYREDPSPRTTTTPAAHRYDGVEIGPSEREELQQQQQTSGVDIPSRLRLRRLSISFSNPDEKDQRDPAVPHPNH